MPLKCWEYPVIDARTLVPFIFSTRPLLMEGVLKIPYHKPTYWYRLGGDSNTGVNVRLECYHESVSFPPSHYLGQVESTMKPFKMSQQCFGPTKCGKQSSVICVHTWILQVMRWVATTSYGSLGNMLHDSAAVTVELQKSLTQHHYRSRYFTSRTKHAMFYTTPVHRKTCETMQSISNKNHLQERLLECIAYEGKEDPRNVQGRKGERGVS